MASPSPSPPAPRSSPFSDAELAAHSRAGLATVESYHSGDGIKGWVTQRKTGPDGSGVDVVEDAEAPVDFEKLASDGDLTVVVQYKLSPNQPSPSPPPAAKSPEPVVPAASSSWGSWAASFVPTVVSDSVNAVVAAASSSMPRYVWKGLGLVAHSPEALFRLFHDQDNQPQWNKALLDNRVVRTVKGTRTSVTVTVSAPAAGGAVSSREFVDTHDWNRIERQDDDGHTHVDYSFAGAGLADHEHDVPANPSYVRGLNAASGFLMRSVKPAASSPAAADPNARWTLFVIVIDTSVGGWIPRSLTDQATPDICVEFINNLRQVVKHREKNNAPHPPMPPDAY